MTSTSLWGLPDPGTKPGFYADTASNRLIAWIPDIIPIMLICALIVPFRGFYRAVLSAAAGV